MRDLTTFMLQQIPVLVTASITELAEAGLSHREAERTLREATGRLSRTMATHFRSGGEAGSKAPVSLEGLVDIEESIWAPQFGIKGVVDATMLVRYPPTHPSAGTSAVASGESQLGLAAVEFKSGKRYHSHAAQVALYGLLLRARYGVAPLNGLLWYSSSDDMEPAKLKPQDIAGAASPLC